MAHEKQDPANLTGHLDQHTPVAETLPGRIKISVWLDTSTDSHGIQDHKQLAENFKQCTGEDACWPTHTVRSTQEAIEGLGLGGYVNGKPDQLVTWGYEVARSLAAKYAPGYQCTKMGRGYIWREALEALKAACV